MEAKTQICTQSRGEKAQYVPTRPSDADMHPDNNVLLTLDMSLLCALSC